MALKNNKGFSLIEIIIAIAVLTLLLTPIMKQFAQTLEVSRLAKEQQYVNEEAVYTLEKAQVSSDKELAAEYNLPTSATVTCDLVDIDGSKFSGTSKITYTRDEYSLGQVEVGARNTVYNKSLVVDDISAQVGGYKVSATEGCNIKYSGFTESQRTKLVDAGYEFTNEGSCVKYDGNGAIVSIVCETTPYVGNPNATNLGNIQNVDVDTVALIDGTTARYDDQADKALYAYAMEQLKELDYDSWDQAMNHGDGDGLYSSSGYNGKIVNKLTKFHIEEGIEDGKKYYYIQVDVYYQSKFTLVSSSDSSKTKDCDKDLKYPVFAQTFYTDECPNIFFEYQPYISSMSGTSVRYASDDYILIESLVEDVKIYMYKPANDALTVANGGSNYSGTVINPLDPSGPKIDYDDVNAVQEYKISKDNSTPVKIHVADMDSNSKKTTIVTNLNIANNFVYDSACSSLFDNVSPTPGSIEAFCQEENGKKYIIPLNEDTRINNRLKSVTVTMTPDTVDANTVSLTGAKGEK